MSNPYFRFKQFTVWHDRCAMKVGTDGVLIGAWCDVDACRRILDVGCGTGLISLMIAQRTPDRTMIEGVEIDAVAAEQAAENTDRSPWKNRLRIHTSDFLDFATSTTVRYDHIVSNPPYFEKSLLPEDVARLTARHTGCLTYESLLRGAVSLLLPGGRISLIFPAGLHDSVSAIAREYGLFVRRTMWVSGREGMPPKRVMVEWVNKPSEIREEHNLAIETAPLEWTPEYIDLTRDFYLQL